MLLVIYDDRKLAGKGHESRTFFLLNNIFTLDKKEKYKLTDLKDPISIERIIKKIKPSLIYFDSYDHNFVRFITSFSIPLILFADILLDIELKSLPSNSMLIDPFDWTLGKLYLKNSFKLKLLKGIEYCPIKPQKLEFQKFDEMFVILRANSSLGYMQHLLQIVLCQKIKKIYFHINFLETFSKEEEIFQKIYKVFSNINFIDIQFEMGSLDYEYFFKRSRYVVSTASMASIEAISYGCCSFLYSIALNQESILKTLVEKNLAIKLVEDNSFKKNLLFKDIPKINKLKKQLGKKDLIRNIGSKLDSEFKLWHQNNFKSI